MTLKILLGDDQDAFPDEYTEILDRFKTAGMTEKYGLKFDFATDEEDFKDYIQEKKYDIIITDLNWTAEDSQAEYKTGYRNLDTCRDLAPIRILRSTDVNKPEVREKAMYYGATHLISKADDFQEELEKILEESSISK